MATAGIPTKAIVQRVKCEISDAFDRRTDDEQFRWLASWTVKVDLNLQASAQGGINPGGSFIDPLPNAFPTNVGPNTLGGTGISSVRQQFSLGFGLNASERAIRTEIVSFSLALDELKAWRRTAEGEETCGKPEGLDLTGHLGLKEWIDDALAPVPSDLQAGDHPTPNAAKAEPAQAPKGGGGIKTIQSVPKPFERAERAITNAKASVAAATSSYTATDKLFKEIAGQHAKLKSSVYYPVLNQQMAARAEAVYTEAQRELTDASDAKAKAQKALDNAEAEKKKIGDEADDSKAANDAAVNAEADAAAAALAADGAKKQAEAMAKNVKRFPTTKLNPPVDALSQSTQFILSYGASISPNWMLVRWSGPTGPLGSVSGITTHTLNIAIGPRPQGGAATNPEVQRILQNLTVQQLKN